MYEKPQDELANTMAACGHLILTNPSVLAELDSLGDKTNWRALAGMCYLRGVIVTLKQHAQPETEHIAMILDACSTDLFDLFLESSSVNTAKNSIAYVNDKISTVQPERDES